MKKFFVLLIAAALFAAPRVSAQDMFNHMSLGVTLGVDGVGLEIAAPMGNHFQLRGGYAIFPYTYEKSFNFGTVNVNGTSRDMNNIPLSATLFPGGNANLLVDYYPFNKGPFRLTAGLYVGTGRLLKADADLRKPLTTDEYGTLGVGFGHGEVSTDKQGYAHLDGKVNGVMPYVGLGLGRGVMDNRVTVTFDLGIIATGGIKPQSYNYVKNTLSASNPVETVPITSSFCNNKDKGLIDKYSKIAVFPIMKLGILFKLF